MSPPRSDAAGEPPDLVRAGWFPRRREANDHGLVVLAMNLPYWIEETVEGYGILVEAAQLAAVQREFELYDRANADWPPRALVHDAPATPLAWFTPMLWATSVVWVFGAQWGASSDFVARGALDAVGIWERGEWWRVVTALWLHADLLHVLANITIGTVIFALVVRARGVARGWWDLLLAAAVGNAATAAFHLADGATSIGASTAVFAGIGWLTGHAARTAWHATRLFRWRAIFVPLSAGFVLLGWLGAGDARTDVVAHAFGFLAGLVFGACVRPRTVSPAPSP